MTIISTRGDFTTTTWKETTADFWKLAYFSTKTKDVWKTASAVVLPPQTTRSRRHHPSVVSIGVFLQRGNTSDRLRDTLVLRMTTKHTTAYSEYSDQEHVKRLNTGCSCCLWSEAVLTSTMVEQGYRKGAKACMRVCIRVFVCGEYYNLTPECKDTHATSTAIKVLQSLEEHFVTACTLVKPHR